VKKYELEYSEEALQGLAKLKRSEPAAYKKALKLLRELEISPREGTGKPELLSKDLSGYWSRRITKRHRLVYDIRDEVVLVYVISAWGHY